MHTIYRLPADEFYRYKTHLLCLDEESRYMRFGYPVRSDQIKELAKRWQDNADKNIIFVIENNDLEVVAVGHISLEETPAELAFSVFKEYQRQGMGDALMTRCIEYCQNHNIKNGQMVCLSSNEAIKKLARRHKILVKSEHGDSSAEIQIPDPSPISILGEVVKDQLGNIDHLTKAQRKFAKLFNFTLHS